MSDICRNNVEYFLLVETLHGWKYIYVHNDLTFKTNRTFIIMDVKILENSKEKIIFTIGNKYSPQYYHCYERIGDNEAIYFYKKFYTGYNCIGNYQTVTRLIFITNSKCQNHMSFITNDNSPLIRERYSTLHVNIEHVELVCFRDESKEYKSKKNKGPKDNEFLKSIGPFVYNKINGKLTPTYSKFLLHIYNIFLPIVRLVRIENILIMSEANLINNTIDILCEENKSIDIKDDNILPILLLRAVILEYSLLCYRQLDSISI